MIVFSWYGFFYVAAAALAWWFLPQLARVRKLELSRWQWLDVATLGLAGALMGGRLGYVLLYEPLYYWLHGWEIFDLSAGGMSSHGGFIGMGLVLLIGAKWLKINYWQLLDVVVVPAALGLALGRLGNVINHELYVTPLAQVVAVGQHLVIAGICYWNYVTTKKIGRTTGLFLILYSLARLFNEYLRESEWNLVLGFLTRGQAYTLPLFLIGLWLWGRTKQSIDPR